MEKWIEEMALAVEREKHARGRFCGHKANHMSIEDCGWVSKILNIVLSLAKLKESK